jgi:hypothetical protein
MWYQPVSVRYPVGQAELDRRRNGMADGVEQAGLQAAVPVVYGEAAPTATSSQPSQSWWTWLRPSLVTNAS